MYCFLLVKTVIKKINTAIIIKINKKKNDNLTENNKNNTKQTILYFDTLSWNVCKIKEIHAVSCNALKTIILKQKE